MHLGLLHERVQPEGQNAGRGDKSVLRAKETPRIAQSAQSALEELCRGGRIQAFWTRYVEIRGRSFLDRRLSRRKTLRNLRRRRKLRGVPASAQGHDELH